MANKHLLPMTRLGRWGFGLIISAVILLAISMTVSFLARNDYSNTAFNVLGVLAPIFILFAFAGVITSWIAVIWRKDRGIILIIFASVLTALILFFGIGEIIEAIMMIGGN